MSRKEVLSKPGPSELFARRIGDTVDWARDHRRYLFFGALGVLVIVILTLVWTRWQSHRRGQASMLLHQALKLVNDDSEAKPPANPDQAIKKLQAIIEQYGSTPAGARAYWHLGHLYLEQGKTPEALKAYQEARQHIPDHQILSSSLAILDIGYAQEMMDACGEAISSYESVVQSGVNWLHGEAYLGMGRCHEKAGATQQAIEVYNRALADVNVNDAAQQTIRDRLAALQPSKPEEAAAKPANAETSTTPAPSSADQPSDATEADKPK
jgi:predicted negative regulator of RcsB-dependent stress response